MEAFESEHARAVRQPNSCLDTFGVGFAELVEEVAVPQEHKFLLGDECRPVRVGPDPVGTDTAGTEGVVHTERVETSPRTLSGQITGVAHNNFS